MNLPKEIWIKFNKDGSVYGVWTFEPWLKDQEYVCGVAHKFVMDEPKEKENE